MPVQQTWKDVVAQALAELGGEAHLSEINGRLSGHPRTRTNPTWQDTIRRVVRQYNIFEPVPPERSGRYRLVDRPVPEPQEASLGGQDIELDHSTAQGMLVNLGRVFGYETFVPKADQTQRKFQRTILGQLVSVTDCTGVFRGPNARDIGQIDVIWLTEDEEGLYPSYAFEVEHSTRVQAGMVRLLKIPGKYRVPMFIVGPDDTEKRYSKLVEQVPFRPYRDRFSFRPYSALEAVYNAAVEYESTRERFGIIERYRNL